MHQIYEDQGIFNLVFSIPQMLYSAIISSVINIIIRYFSISEKQVIELKRSNIINIEKVLPNIIKKLKIKFFCFFLINFVFLGFFWYYIGCFCAVYKNTQLYLIKDTLISFGLSLIFPFVIYLIPGIIRIPALKDHKCFYNLSKLLQSL